MADDAIDAGDGAPARDVLRRGIASAGALLVALLLVALVVWVAEANRERDEAAALERNSFEVMLLSRNIAASIGQAESALGRYVIGSNRALGTLYRDQWRMAGRQIDQLATMVRGNPRQVETVDGLRAAYRARGGELANTASYATFRRNWEALSLHNESSTTPTSGAITRALSDIADYERDVLEQRALERRESTALSNILSNLLIAAAVLLGLIAVGLGWTTLRVFSDRLIARQRGDRLEAAVAARTAELVEVNAELRAESAEREAAEEKLRQIQKMEAVGQLTGGIAHDFNNMLAVVVGALDLAQRKLAKGKGDVAPHIEHALEGANRAAALTRRLLAFARAEPLLPEGTDPVALIHGMKDLIERAIGERIAVSIAAHDGVWPVWVDPHQLENGVLNLAVNARDAMEDGGELRIDVRNAILAEGEVGEAAAGEYVRVAVSDTGAGMTPEVRARVLEPFFTTKPVGKGTGLGLSQIFGFARQSGGDIDIESVPGEGATVALYLPRFAGDAAHRPRGAADAARPSAGGESEAIPILIVEDDDRVRRATAGAIEELGHLPIACASGEAAIDVLAERDDIRLIVSDIVMPGMTGPEFVAAIAADHGDIPVLYVTGYVGEAGDAGQLLGREVLRKPFTIAALARAIDMALSAPRPESAAEAAE